MTSSKTSGEASQNGLSALGEEEESNFDELRARAREIAVRAEEAAEAAVQAARAAAIAREKSNWTQRGSGGCGPHGQVLAAATARQRRQAAGGEASTGEPSTPIAE